MSLTVITEIGRNDYNFGLLNISTLPKSIMNKLYLDYRIIFKFGFSHTFD